MTKRTILIFVALLVVSGVFVYFNHTPKVVTQEQEAASENRMYQMPTKPTLHSIPSMVDINGITWRITLSNDLGSLKGNTVKGLTDCQIREIFLLKSDEDKHTSVMHEITHASVCTDAGSGFNVNNLYYNSTTSEEHEGIYRFSEFWAAMLQRNPELAAYLGQEGS